MTRFADLELLLRTADLGSLTAASKALDWSPAAASAAVQRLEAALGVPLFIRTTRSLRLSPEGERYVPHARRALQALADAQEAALGTPTALRGLLRVSITSDLGRHVLLPWLIDFQRQHPSLQLGLSVGDYLSDMLRSPVDVAIRYGAPADSSLIAQPLLKEHRRVLVAAPAYLAAHGQPQSAADLYRHNALRFMVGGQIPSAWRLQIDGKWQDVPVRGDRFADDGEIVKRWLLAGLGLAYKARLDVVDEIADGRLIHVRPQWLGEELPLNLVVPNRRQLSPPVRQLRDWLATKVAARAGV